MDPSDVFEDDVSDDELQHAGREMKQKLHSIETAAFHEAFEESREKSLQQAFDTGYELIFKYFQAISMLEGIFDSAYQSATQTTPGEKFDDIKPQFASIYSELFTAFNQQIDKDVESKICIERTYRPIHIIPSNELIEKFNQTKQNVIDLCVAADLSHLCPIVENINL